jgi:hypothetical protein
MLHGLASAASARASKRIMEIFAQLYPHYTWPSSGNTLHRFLSLRTWVAVAPARATSREGSVLSKPWSSSISVGRRLKEVTSE